MSEKNVCPNQDLNHQKKIFNFIHYFILHVTSLFEITIFLKHEFFQIRGFHFFTKDLNNNAKKIFKGTCFLPQTRIFLSLYF